jgi:hypothetical protein
VAWFSIVNGESMTDSDSHFPLEKAAWKSVEDQCVTLGEMMGMDTPVPENILLAALDDDTYARQLIASRNAPVWRDYLLQHPPKAKSGENVPAQSSHSNLQLIARASKALLRWGRIGFSAATPELIARRENACLNCPHLRPPNSSLEKLATPAEFKDEPGERLGNLVCGMCGCGARNKIRLPSESCPDAHPTAKGYNRWGEENG